MIRLFKYAAIAGNALMILWLVYNAIDSGFYSGPAEIAVVFLLFLLVLNIILLARQGNGR